MGGTIFQGLGSGEYHLPGVGEWGYVPSSRNWGVGVRTIFQGLGSGGYHLPGVGEWGSYLPGVGEWGVPSSRGWGVGGKGGLLLLQSMCM